MSTVNPDTSRETATPLTDGCNNNRIVCIRLTVSVSVLQDVIKIKRLRGIKRLCWKCNCSCVLSRLKNKSSKFYKISSVLNYNYAKNSAALFCCWQSIYDTDARCLSQQTRALDLRHTISVSTVRSYHGCWWPAWDMASGELPLRNHGCCLSAHTGCTFPVQVRPSVCRLGCSPHVTWRWMIH